MEYATRIERFRRGDYPSVCVRSGRPAEKWVTVVAGRSAAWPWLLFPMSILSWFLASACVDRDHLTGRLPFANGHVGGVRATWDRRERVVILKGVHPTFVEACRQQQAGNSSSGG